MSALMAFAPLANVNMPGYPDGALVPNPFAIAPESVIWDVVAMVPTFLVAIGILVLAAVSLIARYRHSVGVERAQMRWMATAVGTTTAMPQKNQ